jgi:hypothetical protein
MKDATDHVTHSILSICQTVTKKKSLNPQNFRLEGFLLTTEEVKKQLEDKQKAAIQIEKDKVERKLIREENKNKKLQAAKVPKLKLNGEPRKSRTSKNLNSILNKTSDSIDKTQSTQFTQLCLIDDDNDSQAIKCCFSCKTGFESS